MDYWNSEPVEVNDLIGKILSSVEHSGECITFTTQDNEVYEMYHEQDCCESVYIESLEGLLEDLVGSPILMAEEINNLDKEPVNSFDKEGSYTWTFYKFATEKGYVTIRWYGSSNGYYSESVSFRKMK